MYIMDMVFNGVLLPDNMPAFKTIQEQPSIKEFTNSQ